MLGLPTGRGMLLACALALAPHHARADAPKGPPPNGWYGYMAGRYLVCDSLADVKAIVEASAKTQGKGLVPKLMELNAKPNGKGEASCAFMALGGPFAVGESVDLGDTYTDAGLKAHSWAVHAGNSDHDWYFVYANAAEEPQPPKASFTFDDRSWTTTMQGM